MVSKMSIRYYIDQEIKDSFKLVKAELLKDYKEQEKASKLLEVHITHHKGKLQGIQSINTNSLTNPFCKAMSKNRKNVCSKCYSNRLISFRKELGASLERNSILLSEKALKREQIPKINALYFRLHSFGELINKVHFENFMRIASANPKTTFALWSKRIDLIQNTRFDIPPNMIIIYSNPILNEYMKKPPMSFDKVFSVFTAEYALENNININCGARNCLGCLNCYEFNHIGIINEVLK